MDRSLKGLLHKERKMMKGFYIGLLFIPTIIFIFHVSFGIDATGAFTSLMAFGYVILPFAILFSLNTEAIQLGLWLHHPASIHKLLFVKFFNGLMYAFYYLLAVSLLIIGAHFFFGIASLGIGTLIILCILVSIQMIVVSIFFAAILLLFWTLYRFWRSYIGGLSIVAIIVFIHLGIQLESAFHATTLYDALTNWGAITMPSASLFVDSEFLSGAFGAEQFEGLNTTFMLGNYVYYAVISLLCYFISTYLIDRKVEV